MKKVLATLIAVLISASASAQSVGDQANQAYRQGNYALAIELLRGQVATAPTDAKSRILLISALLKKNDVEAAQVQFDALKIVSPGETKYIEVVGQMFAAVERQKKFQADFLDHINHLDAKKALAVLDTFDGDPAQKIQLTHYVNLFAGNYAEARKNLSDLRQYQPAVADLERQLATREAASARGWQRVHALFSGLDQLQKAPKNDKFLQELKLEALQKGNWLQKPVMANAFQVLLSQTAQLFDWEPFNPAAQDLAFWQSLYIAPYEAVQAFGDLLLEGKGRITIPIEYGSGGWKIRPYAFVIDRTARSMSTEASWIKGPTLALPSDFKYFTLPFDKVTKLHQGFSPPVAFSKGNFDSAVFSDKEQVESIAFTMIFTHAYGPIAGSQVVNNLGHYVLHVLNSPAIDAKLVEFKAKEGRLGLLSTVVASAGTIAGAAGMDPAAFSRLAVSIEQAKANAAASERASNLWAETVWMKEIQKNVQVSIPPATLAVLEKLLVS